ncbi:MAG: DMT family transporter [Pseudorhodoplanes sp.]|nr:DMT family transporter [Pseudorhodoplanes sp.]
MGGLLGHPEAPRVPRPSHGAAVRGHRDDRRLRPAAVHGLGLIGHGHFPTTAAAWTSFAGLAVLSSVLPFLAYQYGVKMVGPSIASIFLYFLPVYGVAFAVVFLGEAFRPYHAAGFVLVTLGVVLATAPIGGSRVAAVAGSS